MEIKLSQNLSAVSRLASGPVRPREVRVTGDNAAFERADALNQALAATPGVRPEVVARARALVADSNYPPLETIRQIANLLAVKLESDPK